MKKVMTIFLAVIMSLAVFTGCQSSLVNTGDKEIAKILSVNIGPEPETIDPALNTTAYSSTLIIHAFEGLMTIDKKGEPVEGQAKDFVVSDDGLTYTFILRDDIKWSDGQPVVAEDFIYSWKRVIDPTTASKYSNMFNVIVGAEDINTSKEETLMDNFGAVALDEKTIEIKLIEPTPYFLELLAHPTYMPVRKDIIDGNQDWATNPETYISNGPYQLKSWTHDSEMDYVKNQNYYDLDKLGPDEIKFKLMSDDNAILSAYENGEILFADSMPQRDIDAWKDSNEFFSETQLGTNFIELNTKVEPFDDPKVRKALSLVIDRNLIAQQKGKFGELPATAFVSTGIRDADISKKFREVGGDYYSVAKKEYRNNVAEAKKLLTEAGYPDGEGFPKIEYTYDEDLLHNDIAQALQKMWKEQLGIETSLLPQESSELLETKNSGNFQVISDSWVADYNDPISFIDKWTTTSENNDADWSNAKYDELVNEIKLSNDNEERFAKMHEAEDILMEEMPVIPIFYDEDLYLKRPNLEGFYTSPLGLRYFMYTKVK